MLIAGAHALLSLSFDEGFDLPVSEARAIGTPVIASGYSGPSRTRAPDATLIDPLDGPGGAWLAAIESFSCSRTVSEPRTPFSWKDHFNDGRRGRYRVGDAGFWRSARLRGPYQLAAPVFQACRVSSCTMRDGSLMLKKASLLPPLRSSRFLHASRRHRRFAFGP